MDNIITENENKLRYYTINEDSARRAKEMMSFSDYIEGSTTAEYKNLVDEVYTMAEKVMADRGGEKGQKALNLADRYAKKLAEYFNNDSRIGCMCASVMIAGPSNFPVRKKEKQNQAHDRNMEFYNEVKGVKERISNLLYCKEIINSKDADAIEQLQDKADRLNDLQDLMKGVNAYYKKNNTIEGCSLLNEDEIRKLQAGMNSSYHLENKPYPTWALTNNRQNLKATLDRLKGLEKAKERGTTEEVNDFCTVIENTEIMRLQLIFDGKPNDETRKVLKSNGFRWAPSEGAWQRQLTENARYSAKTVIGMLKELNAS